MTPTGSLQDFLKSLTIFDLSYLSTVTLGLLLVGFELPPVVSLLHPIICMTHKSSRTDGRTRPKRVLPTILYQGPVSLSVIFTGPLPLEYIKMYERENPYSRYAHILKP
ncbi:hypothetical protein K474DRAFT_92341 [Panus rudis PR-1116 ss-1]|nr:hypothetical protein K474DRAFT_92341 [Panus rudis PR-1116 ss-1]